jgi:hypothetical protein
METLKKIKKEIEGICEFGDIPAFSVQVGTKYIYVCRNNGAFHKGEMTGVNGYATFVGKFTTQNIYTDFQWTV